jgi:hypothetical protein
MGLFNTVKTPDNTYHAVSLPYGYCETASATAAKVIIQTTVDKICLIPIKYSCY